MRFMLKPAVRYLVSVFSGLLIGLPIGINAADDKPGPVLPPPSLYDVAPLPQSPAPQAVRPSAPATPMQSESVPAPSSEKAATTPYISRPGVSTPPSESAAAPRAAPARTGEAPSRPWYRRLFSWLPSFSRSAPSQQAAVEAPVTMPAVESNQRGLYAYDGPSRTVRTGMLGQCVRLGTWSSSAANAECDQSAVASATPKAPLTTAQAPRPYAAGPAPAPVRAAPAKPEPVEVVPLPASPSAARDERPLDPPAEREVKERIITALAQTRPMHKPDLDKLTLSAGALFPLSSTAIKPLGREKLDDLAMRLKDMDYETVRVVGYTDPTGPSSMNERLSKRRAESVKSYLASKGIDPKRIQTMGKGGAEPMPKTQDCDALPRMEKIICYAPDRRVEIEVIPAKPRA